MSLRHSSDNSPTPILDNVSHRQTPEGIELSLMPAGIVPRMGAWLIDAICRMGLLYGLALLVSFFGNAGLGVMMIGYFLLDWFYPVLFEVFRGGQTIGKKQFGLIVCQEDGTPIRWQASVLRNLLRTADFLPFAFMGGIVSMLFHPASKRLGDIVAGTLVIYADDKVSDYFAVYDTTALQHFSPIALPMPLELDEQQAILAFAERANTLPTARKVELAQLLTKLTANPAFIRVDEMPNQIMGFANTILGKDVGKNLDKN